MATRRPFVMLLIAAVTAVAIPATASAEATEAKRFPECGINSLRAQNRLSNRYPAWNSYFNAKGRDWSCRYLQYTLYEAGSEYSKRKQNGYPVAAKRAVVRTGRWHFISVAGVTDGFAPKWVGHQYWKAFRYWYHLPLD